MSIGMKPFQKLHQYILLVLKYIKLNLEKTNNMKDYFTISSAYKWNSETKIDKSSVAIKRIVRMIQSRFDGKGNKKEKYDINYRRLRSSAGRTILSSIFNRIKGSQVIIFDISSLNNNVFIELGAALAFSESSNLLSVYIIRERSEKKIPKGIPTDLHGYFITEYAEEKNEIVFKDHDSLRMSIESDVKEYFNQFDIFSQIDEISDDEK